MKHDNLLIEQYRVRLGPLGSDPSYGNNGLFVIETADRILRMIASDGQGWEHVSVSLEDRCPTWAEMQRVKELFWTDKERVVQYHPPAKEHVNRHPFCLHLWRPKTQEIPYPPSWMVG